MCKNNTTCNSKPNYKDSEGLPLRRYWPGRQEGYCESCGNQRYEEQMKQTYNKVNKDVEQTTNESRIN